MSNVTRAWAFFFLVEAAGFLSWAMCGLFQGKLGPFLWGTGFILTLPGTMIFGPVVEGSLWGSHLGLRTISIASVLAGILANTALFSLIIFLVRWVRRRGAI
jgi:hypothetical protein